MKNNVPCATCKHPWNIHVFEWSDEVKNSCAQVVSRAGVLCPCLEFVPDNLGYLEQKYEDFLHGTK